MLLIQRLKINLHCACRYATHTKYSKDKRNIDKSKFSRNPGIQYQLSLFREENPDVENMKFEDVDLEKLEADFMKAGNIADKVGSSLEKAHFIHKFKTVQQKYFKPDHLPNLLTWGEKEQIRYLHNDNPSHWTPEKLAGSFPATPDIIKKILKASWKPKDDSQIVKHDENVAKNWDEFVNNRLEIDRPDLREHLHKFSSRKYKIPSFSDTDLKKLTDNPLPKPKTSEFSSIISSYTKQTEEPVAHPPAVIDCSPENKTPTYFKRTKNDKTEYPLELLKQKVKKEVERSKVVSEENMLLLSERKRNLGSNIYVASSERFDCDAVVTRQGKLNKLTDVNEENYPQRIFIPKNKRKSGALYKVNDCFYASDGYFLYRVPGFA